MPAEAASHVSFRRREGSRTEGETPQQARLTVRVLRGQAESVRPGRTAITGFHMENSLLMRQVPGAG